MGSHEQATLLRLQNMVHRVWNAQGSYRQKMEVAGISPDDIQSIDDFKKLPFTTKQDLRDSYPLGMLACPREQVVRLHASSGTTGKPTFVPYTQKDIDIWKECMAECLATAGVAPNDVFQIILGYGLFTGALGFHYGAEKLGAMVIPSGGGFTDRQLMLMEDAHTTVFTSTPSYALYLAERVAKESLISRLHLRLAILGGEAWTEDMGSQIEEMLGVTVINSYGLSEILGPGVAMECGAKRGMHFNETHFFAETVNAENGKALLDGEFGELVITTMTKEAFPLIRYRTRDLTSLISEPCPCGRHGKRIARVTGRNDDMLIIRGVNIFPSQVEAALADVKGISLHYRLDVDHKQGMPDLTVVCESVSLLSASEMEKLRTRTSHCLKEHLGIRVDVRIEAPEALGRNEGKALRVLHVA
ncbi:MULTISPECIES: phenylacetate--CoA ligase family protein [Aminobacterium]|jgi:phenylacetate-CoA ligase|uniref:phenylacetate--CoA ligase family protein n=1 Tax=Aminobacterium TaxID=81466 RepID=UPI00257E2492|nr:phenylacetate--CoA ligase [Aminobacterium sp. UBA4987]